MGDMELSSSSSVTTEHGALLRRRHFGLDGPFIKKISSTAAVSRLVARVCSLSLSLSLSLFSRSRASAAAAERMKEDIGISLMRFVLLSFGSAAS